MAWTCYQKFLASMMFVTGSINTLSTKWADRQEAEGWEGSKAHMFDHPFLQAVGMFLGELSCLGMFHIIKNYRQRRGQEMELGNQGFNPIIFLPPAMCDMCGTSLMYIGLNLTHASSFQMLRGAVIIFTALLSVAFLGRSIKWCGWLGILFVICGLTVVGLSDILYVTDDIHDKNGIIAGDLLIVMAQIIVATQMVYEERFINKHNIPALQAVGWEGFFGFCVLGFLLIPFYFIKAGTFSKLPEHRLEDAIDGFVQIANNWMIALAVLGNILSIAFFNFSGISVTKEMSATTRMVLDSLRTIAIWGVSLAVQWQMFQYLQLIGFASLLVGMFLYNEVIIVPGIKRLVRCITGRAPDPDDDDDPLLNPNDPDIQDAPHYEPVQADRNAIA